MTRRAFTLIELLVVIAIIGILLALLVPAVQRVREASNRLSCQNNLKQLALACSSFHGTFSEFPPGYERQPNRNASFFCHLLPFIEQAALFQKLDWAVPTNNQLPGGPATIVIKGLVCPSANLDSNPEPLGANSMSAALSSYGGNGGTISLPLDQAKNDGIFHETGALSKPKANQVPVRLAEILDGTTQTILLGERSHYDGAWDSWLSAPLQPKPSPPIQPFRQLRAWAPASPMALYHVTHSGIASLNGTMGRAYTPPPPTNPPTPPPPVPLSDIEPYMLSRWMAYGSKHTGGVNFAFVDGSARAILPSVDQAVLMALSSRAGGETPAW